LDTHYKMIEDNLKVVGADTVLNENCKSVKALIKFLIYKVTQ
jgi:hypothetical protein